MVANASEINCALEALLDRTAYLYRRRGADGFNIAVYGANPLSSAAVNTPLIQAAINAAAVVGGTVWVPPGVFPCNGLTWPAFVNWDGVPGVSGLQFAHATDPFFNITGVDGGPAVYMRNLALTASVAAAGAVFQHTSGGGARNILYDNVSVNKFATANLQGRILHATQSTGQRHHFKDCYVRVGASVQAFRSDLGYLEIEGGTIVAPATYGFSMVSGAAGEQNIHGVTFDLTPHTTSTLTCIDPSGADTIVNGCRFVSAGSGVKYALRWTSGAKINAQNNNAKLMAMYGSTSALAVGSYLELEQSNASSSLPPPNGFRLFSHNSSNVGPSVDIPMPAAFYAGQAFVLSLVNGSGTNWTSTTLSHAVEVYESGIPAINTGNGAVCEFVAADPFATGDLHWLQVGAWQEYSP